MSSKVKNINFYIVVLIVINLSTLGYLFYFSVNNQTFKRMPEQHPPEILSFLSEKLDFTEEQSDKLKELRAFHFSRTDQLKREQHDLKRMVMKESFRENPDSMFIDSLSETIGEIQFKLEKTVSDHFMEISNICNPKQREKLFRLFDEINRLRK